MNTRCVIGIGCDDHGDQIAGLLVARAVAERSYGDIVVVESSGAPQHLARAWSGHDSVVIVEAMPGTCPGTVHTSYPHPRMHSGDDPSARLSSRLREALALRPLPERVIVITIEAQWFMPNAPATPQIVEAAGRVAERIVPAVPAALVGV